MSLFCQSQTTTQVPSTQRLERVSLLGRHLLQACVDTEEAHGKGTLNKLKVGHSGTSFPSAECLASALQRTLRSTLPAWLPVTHIHCSHPRVLIHLPLLTQVVLAVDEEQGYFVLSELRQWSFFGLNHANVLILPLPRFPGYGVSQKVRARSKCA